MIIRPLATVAALVMLLLPTTAECYRAAHRATFFYRESVPYASIVAIGNSFQMVATKWSADYPSSYVTNVSQQYPCDTSDPRDFSYTGWIADFTDTRLFSAAGHGGPEWICVEAYTTPDARTTRWNVIPAGDRSGLYYWEFNYSAGGATFTAYCIVLNLSGFDNMTGNLDASAIVTLATCNGATHFASRFYAKCAKAVFAAPDMLYAPDGYNAAAAIWDVLGCGRSPWKESRAADAAAVLDSLGKGIYAQKNYSEYDGTVRPVDGKSCIAPSVRFVAFGKTGSTVYWRGVEEGTTDYYVLGFGSKKREPDFIQRVAPNPLGGARTHRLVPV